MTNKHIAKVYDEELERLDGTVLMMGGLVQSQLRAAMQAIAQHDIRLAAEVVESDTKVDNLEREVDASTVRMLALRQPLANDLRAIVAALRISIDLERIADYAAAIARRIDELNRNPIEKPMQVIESMGKLVLQMVEDALSAYRARDVARAVEVWHRDREVDAMYADLLGDLRSSMTADARNIGACTHLLFTTKSIERIGDHVKNISEHVCFLVHGTALPAGMK